MAKVANALDRFGQPTFLQVTRGVEMQATGDRARDVFLGELVESRRVPGQFLLQGGRDRFVKEHEGLRRRLGELVERILGKVRPLEAIPDGRDLLGDLAEGDPELDRLVAQSLDLGEQSLEALPVGFELPDPPFRLDELGRGLFPTAHGKLLPDPVERGAERKMNSVLDEDVPPARNRTGALFEQLVHLALHPHLGPPERLERLALPTFGLGERRLAEFARGIGERPAKTADEVHLAPEVTADARRDLGLRRRSASGRPGGWGTVQVRRGSRARRLLRAEPLDRERRRIPADGAVQPGRGDRLLANGTTGRHGIHQEHCRDGNCVLNLFRWSKNRLASRERRKDEQPDRPFQRRVERHRQSVDQDDRALPGLDGHVE